MERGGWSRETRTIKSMGAMNNELGDENISTAPALSPLLLSCLDPLIPTLQIKI
jgi:hypothetical protein